MNPDLEQTRIDKWLWSSRIFKTRNQAADACRKGRVFVDGTPAKPSKMVYRGNIVVVRKPPVIYSFQVHDLPDKRLSATLARECYTNLTPEEEMEKLEFLRLHLLGERKKGTGRPTKKERRSIDRIKNSPGGEHR